MILSPSSKTQFEPDVTDVPSAGMVHVAAGTFRMGSTDGGEFEGPVHEVYLDEFLMDSTLTTNRDFATFTRESEYKTSAEVMGQAWGFRAGAFGSISGLSWRSYATPDRELHPVVLVSWNDAVAYCEWAGKRLPTEAEWEKATRGSLAGASYPWGNEEPIGTQSNFAGTPSELPPTTEVKRFPPNQAGLFDMVGNVWQWCSDWYSPGYYASAPQANPTGPSTGETRVRRGGSWNVIQPFRLRCANRGAAPPILCAPNVGFRCVRS